MPVHDLGSNVASWALAWLRAAPCPLLHPALVASVTALHHAAAATCDFAAATLLSVGLRPQPQPQQQQQQPQPQPQPPPQTQPQPHQPQPVDVGTLRLRLSSELRIAVRHARALVAARYEYVAHAPRASDEFDYGLTMLAQRHAKIFGSRYTFRAELVHGDAMASVSAFCEATLVCALHLDFSGSKARVVNVLHAPGAPKHVGEACDAAAAWASTL